MFKDGLGVRGVFWGHLPCGFWRGGRTIDEFGVRYEVSVAHTMNLCDGVMKKSFNHSCFLLFAFCVSGCNTKYPSFQATNQVNVQLPSKCSSNLGY